MTQQKNKDRKSFGPDFLTYMLEREPQTFKAVNSSDGPLWKEAIKSDIDSILQNHTWEQWIFLRDANHQLINVFSRGK